MKDIEVAGRSGDVDSYGKYYKTRFENNGSPKGYDLEKIFNDPQSYVSDVALLARYYYGKVGIIMRVVNIIRDFTVSKYDFIYPTQNKRVKKIIEAYNERIDLPQVLKDVIFELGLTGNCAGYERDGKRVDIYPVGAVEVSPIIVNNKPVLLYKNEIDPLSSGFGNDLNDKRMIKQLESAYPKEVVKGMKKNQTKIVLDVENTFFHKTNSSRYDQYGVTFLLPAFDELAHKTLLKEAERATASGIIDKILHVKVGDGKEKRPKQNEIDFYHDLFDGKKGSLKITTPDWVNLEWVEPDIGIFGKEKFEQVDLDLLSALGVSLTLIRGEGGGNYSEGVIALTGLIKTCENLRGGIPAMVREWHKKELKRNGINPELAPTMKLGEIEIDKSAKLEMLKWLFTTAGLPYEVLYKEAGYDYLNVKLIRESENEEKIEDTFKLREQPFQGQANMMDKGGQPPKNADERKTDKSKSNNDTPRPSNK